MKANMKSLSICLCFSLFLISILGKTKADDQAKDNDIYIVYMGGKATSVGDDHKQLLDSLLRRNAVVHIYKHGFSGFAARLSKEEAHIIAQKPGVVSVFSDPIFQLHTTRSWDFLNNLTDQNIYISSASNSNSSTRGSDTIIGFLDSGIWPESKSFSDSGIGSIPSRWKGSCVEVEDFNSSNCNRKLIGATYYDPLVSPRDSVGHGTHTTATAAGTPVRGASLYGLAAGTAKGGSPGSRIAAYAICNAFGCTGSAIMAAFDDAIHDGVDILSISLGAAAAEAPKLFNDPIAIGAYHAVEHGITVVCSAGNDGPLNGTVTNDAPWIITVAATTIDRYLESNVVLSGNKVIKAGGINLANIKKSPVYPLIYCTSAEGASNDIGEVAVRNCDLAALGASNITGKIVLCTDKDFICLNMLADIKDQGGIGVILINDDFKDAPYFSRDFPLTAVTSKDAAKILSYINSTRNPTATILASVTMSIVKPAPTAIFFSSKGPSRNTRNLLKPDIAAPGVSILAAWRGNDTDIIIPGKEPPAFNLQSGTSMACPHVSGIAATIKSQNPTWSHSAIKSAIMTTAIHTNNLGAPITKNSGSVATPYDFGAGEVSSSGVTQPGLVYETETIDYLKFMCNLGYNLSTIKLIASSIPDGFSCPKNSNEDLISNMNYPSLAITRFSGRKKVTRTVKNVGDEDKTVYAATLDVPAGLNVKVVPDKLQFRKDSSKASYQVIFTSSTPTEEDVFGSITWSNGKYKVRSPFVVSWK